MAKSSFLGWRMAQTPGALLFWENLLSKTKFSRIIEFGTMRGGLSYYFSLFCEERGAEFFTFDNADFPKPDRVRNDFYNEDIFKNINDIRDLIQRDGVTILFCDNGFKRKEIKIFSKFLKKGDILAVHDWMTEVFPIDVPEGLEPIVEGEMTKLWKKSL